VVVTATGVVVVGVIENVVVFGGIAEEVVVGTVNVDESDAVVVAKGVLKLDGNGDAIVVVEGVVVVLKVNEGVVVGREKLKGTADGVVVVIDGIVGAVVVGAPNGVTVAVCVTVGIEKVGATEAVGVDVAPKPKLGVAELNPIPVLLPSGGIGADVEIVAGAVDENERVGVVVVAVETLLPKLNAGVDEVFVAKPEAAPKPPKVGTEEVGAEDWAKYALKVIN
jgi:hypothetical protein